MVQFLLEIFTSEEKAEAILASPFIELIFMALIVGFIIALVVHFMLYSKLKKLRNYISETGRMDVEPLQTFQKEYEKKQQEDSVTVETYVQSKFSSWKVFGIPVVSLIKMIQVTVSVFILIGVLGTFIGLTISLGSISATGDQLVENIASVLAGIDVAFYTSIAGMGFSLIMTILLKTLNTEHMLTDIMLEVESNLEGREDNNLSKLIHVSEMINQSIKNLQESNQQSLGSIEQAFEGFQEYTTGLQQSARDLSHFNDGLSKNLEEFHSLFDQMKEVTDGFGEGTSRLNENFDSLFTYFKRVDEKNERLVQTVEGTYEKVKNASETQKATLQRFEHVVSDLKEFTSSILQGQQSVQDSFGKILQQSNLLVNKMENHNREFKQIFGSDLSAKLTSITSYLAELSREFDRLGECITDLPEALQIINQTQMEYKQLLTDRFEELKHFNRTFGNHLKEHTTESMAFERNLRAATKTFEQVSIKNNQLMQEIDSKINQMNQSFNYRENQMETSVTMLKDTLSSYVSSLEGTFGNRLDQVVRNISSSMDQTNENMKREFMEIRRITEQIQQSNSQYTQQMLQELGREMQALIRQLSVVSQQGPSRPPGIGMNQNGY
ncbi:MotA/TolQ/ExbB proton channel family protein [Ornithinibacillus californiensis]|uniref:MotA/TolQ/ExbB proton channel family protein n=1 Tax=Ornithinibacillus californiensis TaxID=161536 RepID=UPI00064DB627|nr:MotA/TolQ/ExbB proton channel family protein [Ornithinibacillus californiensis]